MPLMTDEAPAQPPRSDQQITERTAAGYREDLIAELEAENGRLRERTDTLQRWLNERTAELRAFGLAAQAVQGARRVVRQPTLLARVPGAALRAVRGGNRSAAGPEPVVKASQPARRLPAPGPSRRIRPARSTATLTVALVTDESLALALGPECRVIRLTAEDWQAQLAADPPDFVLVESAWRGTAGSWQYRIAWYGHPTSVGLVDLRALTGWCASNGVPTIFWDTAGLVAEGRFDEAAALFDIILVSDPVLIDHYDTVPGRHAAIVDWLAPGIQFRRHHPGPVPAAGNPAKSGPIFVGAFDRTRPLADREALERLLDAGLARGLRIHDTAGIAGPDAPGFPERFQASIAPFVGLAALPDLIRQAAVVLVDAPGGDARTIPVAALEALACGVPVVTTPNSAIHQRFGDLVPGAAADDDPGAAIDAILADPVAARQRIMQSILPALIRDDRMETRLASLAQAVRIDVLASPTGVAVAVVHDDPARMAIVAADLAGLADASEYLVGTSQWAGAGSALAAALRAARPDRPVRLVEQDPALSRGQRLERLASTASADWIGAWLDEPATAGPGEAAAGAARPLAADPLAAVLAGTVYEQGDVIAGADPRLALVVRRTAVVATGWPDS